MPIYEIDPIDCPSGSPLQIDNAKTLILAFDLIPGKYSIAFYNAEDNSSEAWAFDEEKVFETNIQNILNKIPNANLIRWPKPNK